MKIFLLRKRYLIIGLGVLLAAAMFLAACLPEVLASAPAEVESNAPLLDVELDLEMAEGGSNTNYK